MLFLYLDESGDLGFDFVNKKPSRYFVVTVLAVQDRGYERKRWEWFNVFEEKIAFRTVYLAE